MKQYNPFVLAARCLTRAVVTSFASVCFVVALATTVFTSCSTADDLNPANPNGPNANGAYLTLSTATIDGAMRNTTTRATPSDLVNGFKAGDVIRIGYSFSKSSKEEAYARMNSDGTTWAIYSDLNFTTPARLCPNPAKSEESWEKLDLQFNFDPIGVVTGTDGKKTYGGLEFYQDETTKLHSFYDRLYAANKCTTAGDLAAGEYWVSTNMPGLVSVKLKHENTLLSLSDKDIFITNYTEKYNGIRALTVIMEKVTEEDKTTYEIPFTYNPGAESGKGTWQTIVPYDYNIKAFIATLVVDGKPVNSGDAVKIPLDAPIKMVGSTHYLLVFSLSPDKSLIRIDPQPQIGWGDNESAFDSDAIEGIDITLSKPGDRNSSEWTILTARGLTAFRDHVNRGDTFMNTNAKLGANIDLEGSPSNRFGAPIASYGGTFDGAGFTISRLSLDYSEGEQQGAMGFFGKIGATGVVRNLNLKNALVNVNNYSAGILAGTNHGHIINCHTSGEVSIEGATEDSNAGGLVGYNAGSIIGCYAESAVTVNSNVAGILKSSGGLVGYNMNGTIITCYYKSDGTNGVGHNNSDSTIPCEVSLVSDWDAAVAAMNAAIKDWNDKPKNKTKSLIHSINHVK